AAFKVLAEELAEAFARADFPEIIRLLDRGFGESTYSLRSLFRDEQRKVMKRVLQGPQAEAETVYRRLYEQNLPTMRFLATLNVPLPRALQTTADFLLNTDLRWAFEDDDPDLGHIRKLLKEAATWHVALDAAGLAYKFRTTLGRMAQRWAGDPAHLNILHALD